MAIDISVVVIGPQLGEGGFGSVHEVVVVGTPIADDARPMVLKTPKPGLDPVHAAAVLEGMRRAVDFRDGLSASDRRQLDEIAVWPVAMVTEQTREVGCLLPLIPPAFFMDIPAQGSFPAKREPRAMGYLAAPAKARRYVGYDSGDFRDYALRLLVLAKLAGAIEMLHRHEMVFGDLGPNNAVFTFMPPRVLLLDCDTVAHISDTTRTTRQGHFPRWLPPEMSQSDKDARTSPKRLQDFETDVYKLGLAFARYIHGAPGATQRVALPWPAPPIITQSLVVLIGRALDPDPAVRPSARQIRLAAEEAVAIGVPEANRFEPAAESPPPLRAPAPPPSAIRGSVDAIDELF